ncbi:MAG: sigma-70 family RNA polymerase sigma factor [Phycisphaerales bacterium]
MDAASGFGREEHAAAMEGDPRNHVTMLLARIHEGDSRAAGELLPVVYDELRRLAKSRLAKERGQQTLDPTALVHEAYLRLVGDGDASWSGRGHFFGAAAIAMRRILVERARARNRLKRGGGAARVELTEQALVSEPPADELLALDEALDRLSAMDARKGQVVMLRYFAGLGVEETAKTLGVSEATVKNDWAFARAWLHRELSKGETSGAEGATR